MKLTIEENSYILHSDSSDRTFRYRLNDVETKVKNIICKTLDESNWSRITQHMSNGCMMISACRAENSDEENIKRTDDLMRDIRNSGLGFIRILGGYIENKGMSDEKYVNGEESFFVPKPRGMSDEDFFDIAIDLCKKYNQDSVLVSLPEYVDFGYYDKSGNFDFSPGNKFIADEKHIQQYYSMLVKGSKSKKKFAFGEGVDWIAVRVPSSSYQAAYMSNMNEYF